MQTQLDFDAADLAEIESTRPMTPREAFDDFDEKNPHVFAAICKRALRRHAEGRKRWSIEEIWNHLRWKWQCKTTGKPYTLNNNYKAFYVRKLVEQNPQLDTMFVLRKARGDGRKTDA